MRAALRSVCAMYPLPSIGSNRVFWLVYVCMLACVRVCTGLRACVLVGVFVFRQISHFNLEHIVCSVACGAQHSMLLTVGKAMHAV